MRKRAGISKLRWRAVLLPPELSDPLQLKCDLVWLEPLDAAHGQILAKVSAIGEIWRNPYMFVPKPEQATAYVNEALAAQSRGVEVPFAIRRPDGAVVGTTRYQWINLRQRRLQLGSTWLGLDARRSGINVASKFLLLRHAVEVLRLRRVEFTTHPDNKESRESLGRLGAVFEGVLRNHFFLNGASRDSAIYSITDSDWPQVKEGILQRMRFHESA